jgi:SWI/SNF-related matrix-associated actin-dependent regulator of chromatin subfamily B protein 1
MRYCALNTDNNYSHVQLPLPGWNPAGDNSSFVIPPNIQFAWLPRIRCRDCPGKSYTAGPETTVTNFEVHLKNKVHRERVVARLGKGGQLGGQGVGVGV